MTTPTPPAAEPEAASLTISDINTRVAPMFMDATIVACLYIFPSLIVDRRPLALAAHTTTLGAARLRPISSGRSAVLTVERLVRPSSGVKGW